MWFVVNQRDVAQLGDAGMNQLLHGVLSFYDIDFKQERFATKAQLKEAYRDITTELEFGDQNTRTYRSLMMEADLMKAKLSGGTTWPNQRPNSSSTALVPNPSVSWDIRGQTAPMGPTTGALYDFNPAQQWATRD